MKKTIRLTESDLHRIVKEELEKFDGRPSSFSEKHTETYRGIPGTKFVWHGEWSDPEVIYKGKTMNYWDCDEMLNDAYDADVENGDFEGDFDNWVEQQDKKYLQSLLDDMIFGMNESKKRNNMKKTIWLTEARAIIESMVRKTIKEELKNNKIDVSENLYNALSLLVEIKDSGYIPFSSPSPSSTEENIKSAINNAIDSVSYAWKLHTETYGR